MGATTQDIFGGNAGAEPALPGTYGEAPRGYRLPDATRIDRVVLQVTNLARSLAYYTHVLGFRRVGGDASLALLAAHGDDRVLVELRERADARPIPNRSRLGLYHFAILVPDRASLGRFVQHLSDVGERAGAGDHLVSEAFYLTDPDGLGIEVYADRPRESWQRVGRELMMATDPVDVRGLVGAAGDSTWAGMPAGTVIGHVHLYVGDVDRAWSFYGEGVGFDRMVWHYPGALFFGAGGYHHHLGTNTWAGANAPRAADDEARLVEWIVEVPAASDVHALADSVERGGFAVTREIGLPAVAAVMRDPWGTQLRVTAGAGVAR
jgi:catechol 2,3-dioxygenase